jgi:hypothetical protein
VRHGEHEILEKVLEVLERVVDLLERIEIRLTQSTTAKLSTGGTDMATTATLTFQDASGNPAAPPKGDGSGLAVVFSSDNPNVTLSTATSSGDTATATATITGTDAFNLSAVVSNTSGADLVDDDGTTAFVQPSPVAVAASTPPVPQAVTAVLSAE